MPTTAVAAALPASPIDLGMAFRILTENAPSAPVALTRLCAQVLANPRSCSDAVLIVADALDECAHDGTNWTALPGGAVFNDRGDLVGLRQLALVMRQEAPMYAGSCRS